jgi:glutathione S-transferase
MAIKMYDLCGADAAHRFSPYCWRTRMALAHKGLDVETVPWRFTETDRLTFSGSKTVPVIVDGDTIVRDSWDIADYLEETYGDRPSLYGAAIGRAEARFISHWTEGALHPLMIKMAALDIHDLLGPVDQAYFRTDREAKFGASLEAFTDGRDGHLPALRAALAPFRRALKDADYLCGATPAYGDYVVFGAFQWCRVTTTLALLESDDPVHAWQERMLDLFDGLGRATPARL